MTLSRRSDTVLAEIAKQVQTITKVGSLYPDHVGPLRFICWQPGDEFGKKFGSLISHPAVTLIVRGQVKTLVCEKEKTFEAGDLLYAATALPVSYEYEVVGDEESFLAVSLNLTEESMQRALNYLDGKFFQYITKEPSQALSSIKACSEELAAFQEVTELAQSDFQERILGECLINLLIVRLLMNPVGSAFANFYRQERIESKIRRATDVIVDHLADKNDAVDIAKKEGIKPSLYHHYFKEIVGLPPGQFKKWVRVTESRCLMIEEGMAATQACYKTGYDNLTYFIIQFKQVFKCTPGKFIQDELQIYPWQQQLAREGYQFK